MGEHNRAAKIRALNDDLRCRRIGGQIMITRGIQALGPDAVTGITTTVASFDAFTEDNDPYGEHDCAGQEWQGHRILWKLDYYNKSLDAGSEDPSDPAITSRILTIMLAEEY